MADYKILQNIDLAQNEIKEVSKISNNIRSDNKDKGLCIQTGEDTSLTLNRKVGENFNYIKGVVKEGTSESVFNVKPSKINISNTKDTTSSSLVLGLDSKGNEHIESVSPLVDIKTGDTEYTDPHISLSQGSLNLKSTKISLNSKEKDTLSSLTMNEGITEKSDTITLQSVSKLDKLDTNDTNDYFKVSLNKTTDSKGDSKGEISLSAKDSITESVGTRSVSIGTSDIVIKDSTTSGTESKIEVNNSGIVASKGAISSITLGSDSLEEKSNTVTITTPNNVTLELKETDTDNSATLNSKGTITLTSNKDTINKEASTTYGNNSIVSKADSIKLQTQGYKDTSTTKFPHIELTSDTTNNSILVEGKTINISSKDSDTKDTINLSGTKLNIKNTTTEITSSTINVTKDNKYVLNINTTTTPIVTIPSNTTVEINSNTIGIGDTNSTTTISGSNLNVGTENTSITSTSTLSGTTTLQSSEKDTKNTLVVNDTSTSITGDKVYINPKIVNIGTTEAVGITIGSNTENNSTTLESKTTNISSPTLSVTSSTVKFGEDTNQEVSFNGSGSVTSNVDTSVVGKTFSVKNKSTDESKDILKADTTSVSLAGSSTSITSKSVSIGTSNTTSITIGRNTDTEDTNTLLTSKITNITSPTVNIGTETTTSLSIGNKTASTVNLSGNTNSDLSITSDTTTSTVKAKNLNFTENLVGNGIKIYWDTTSSSLVFAKE